MYITTKSDALNIIPNKINIGKIPPIPKSDSILTNNEFVWLSSVLLSL